MKGMQKFFSLVLAGVLALQTLPVYAAETETGEEEEPVILVEDRKELPPAEEPEEVEEPEPEEEPKPGSEVELEPDRELEWNPEEESAVEPGPDPVEEPSEIPPEEDGDVQLLASGTPYAVEGGNIYFDPKTGTITNCDTSVTRADIPEEIDGTAVTAIRRFAFDGCKSLTAITIPNGVKSVGYSAFGSCTGLTEIIFPDSVRTFEDRVFSKCSNLRAVTLPARADSMGTGVFYNCASLTDIVIPEGITTLGPAFATPGFFEGCSKLRSVTLPESLMSIGNEVFRNCTSLTDIKIPSAVTAIGEGAFYGCTGLASVVIPSGVIDIGENAFSRCTGLQSVTINGNVASMGKSAFNGCTSLTQATISDGVSIIGDSAFSGCEKLSSITIPPSVTSIGSYAFSNCSGLTGVNLPFGLVSIGHMAFYQCRELTSVILPASITSIGGGAFYYCTSLTEIEIPEGVTSLDSYDGNGLFVRCEKLQFVTIPSTVTSIGAGTFSGCYSLKEIRIPSGVTFIGEKAFNCCSNLTEITIPEGVTSIEDSTFQLCQKLNSVTLPGSLTSIGSSAFYACSSLAEIDIPGTVESVGSSAFYGCKALTTLVIPESVNSIGYEAFRECTALSSITLPQSSSMDGGAFCNCEQLTEVIVPEGVTALDIHSYCGFFEGCRSLQHVTLPAAITSIGEETFLGCASLAEVEIPSGVTSIGCGAFSGCGSLASLVLPAGVASIGSEAFSGCKKLASVNIPDPVTAIEDGTFSQCESLMEIKIPDAVTTIGKYAFVHCSSLSAIAVPEAVVSIGDEAFKECTGAVSITLPPRMDSMGAGVFYKCSSLSELVIPDGVTSLNNIGGIGFLYGCGQLKSVQIPACVTSIGAYAFEGCSNLAAVTIPELVTFIGNSAFSGCKSLTEVVVPSGVTVIENSVFSGCSGLTRVSIPSQVTSIGGDAFNGCPGLTEINIPSQVTSIGGYAFNGCSGLTEVNIPSQVTSIGKCAFAGCEALSSITLPSGITSIESGLFSECTNLAEVTIPISVISIGNSAFQKCLHLSSITLPYGLATIGINAFYDCEKLPASFRIPSTVTEIGAGAFRGCASLTAVEIPSGVTKISSEVFSCCSNLTSVSIPYGVTSIGYDAFYGCDLTSITIPEGVTSIGNSAFQYCDRLVSIRVPSGVTNIESETFLYCHSLTSITLPASISSVGYRAFEGCDSLTSITLPDGVTSIGARAFQKCTALRTAKLSNGLTSIGTDAFRECKSLVSIAIPSGVTHLGDPSDWAEGVFMDCTELETVMIPDSVTYIHSGTFSGSQLVGVYYAGTQTQWNMIEGEWTKSISEDIIHFNSYTPPSPPTASINITNIYSVRLKAKNAPAVDFTVDGVGGGVAGTVSWSSSDPSVFSLASPTSGTYQGLSSSFTIRGNGIKAGTAQVSIQAGTAIRIVNVTVREAGPTTFSGLEDCEVRHRQKNVLAGSFTVENEDDLPVTVTVASSDPGVFRVSSKDASRSFSGSSWMLVHGDALSVGTATITAKASDGMSASFKVTVKASPNELTLSGPRELNSDGASAGDTAKKNGTVRARIVMGTTMATGCTWTTSDPDIVTLGMGNTQKTEQFNVNENTLEYIAMVNVTAVAPGKKKKATITCKLSDGTEKTWEIKVLSDAERKLKELAEAWAAAYMEYNAALEARIKEAANAAANPEKLEDMAKRLEAALHKKYGIQLGGAERDEEARVTVCKALLQLLSERLTTQCALKNIDPSAGKLPASIVNAVAESMDSYSYSYQEKDENGIASVSISGFDAFGATEGHATYRYQAKDGKAESPVMVSFVSSTKKMKKITEDFLDDLTKLNEAGLQAALKEAADELSKALFGKNVKILSANFINQKVAKYVPVFKELLLGKVPEMLIECGEYYDTAAAYLMQGDFEEKALESVLSKSQAASFTDSTIGNGNKENKALKQAVKALEEARKELNSALDEYLRTGKITDKKKPTGLKSIFMCPVRVDIYDGGTQIGSVNDEESWCDDPSVTIEQTAEVKTVYHAKPLIFRLTGTDYGTLHCTFEETAGGEVIRRTNYYDIPLYESKALQVQAEPPVQAEDGGVTEGTVALSEEGDVSIAPSESIRAGDYETQSVQIDCPDVSGGSVLGTGAYVPGDPVRLQALAGEDCVFLGWLNASGGLVCAAPVYEFTAGESLTLTPVFVQDSAAVSPAVVSVSGMEVQSGVSTVTLDDPGGVLKETGRTSVFAAVYNGDGRMEQVLTGTLSETAAVFNAALDSRWVLFLLDDAYVPLCQKLPLDSAGDSAQA